MKQKTLKWIFLLLLPFPLFAQEQGDWGSWVMYFGLNRISPKFSIHTEIQYRNHSVPPGDIEQLLLRTGVNYHLNQQVMISTGYAYIASHDYDTDQNAPENEEHRIWQQLITTQLVGRVKFEHRYRIEQRWVNRDFKNRLRYRLMLTVPLNKPKIETGTWFLGWYDEIFVNTEDTFFDRNRFYGALGYQVSSATNLQFGVMNQRVTDFGKWYLQAAVTFNPNLSKD